MWEVEILEVVEKIKIELAKKSKGPDLLRGDWSLVKSEFGESKMGARKIEPNTLKKCTCDQS